MANVYKNGTYYVNGVPVGSQTATGVQTNNTPWIAAGVSQEEWNQMNSTPSVQTTPNQWVANNGVTPKPAAQPSVLSSLVQNANTIGQTAAGVSPTEWNQLQSVPTVQTTPSQWIPNNGVAPQPVPTTSTLTNLVKQANASGGGLPSDLGGTVSNATVPVVSEPSGPWTAAGVSKAEWDAMNAVPAVQTTPDQWVANNGIAPQPAPDNTLSQLVQTANQVGQIVPETVIPTTPGTTTPTVTPQVGPVTTPATNYTDLYNTILGLINQQQQPVQGTAEQFNPSASQSELAQALQNKGMELLNQPYGYTSEQQNAIWQNTLNQFNQSQEADLRKLQNLYEQYGLNSGAGELGGQAGSSLQDYYGKRAQALSNLSAQMGEYFATKASGDQQAAIQQAQAIQSQLYDQVRGDFADTMAMLQTQDQLTNSDFQRTMQLAGLQDEQAQRDFLNQLGISDRASQDYWMGATTAFEQQAQSQQLSDQGLQMLTDYVNSNTLKPQDYQSLINALTLGEQSQYTDAMNSGLNQPGANTLTMALLMNMLAQGANNNSGGNNTTAGNLIDAATNLPDAISSTAGAIASGAKGLGSVISSGAGALGSVLASAPALAFLAPFSGVAAYMIANQENYSDGGWSRNVLNGTGLENDPVAKYVTFTAHKTGALPLSIDSAKTILGDVVVISKEYGPLMQAEQDPIKKSQYAAMALGELFNSPEWKSLPQYPIGQTWRGQSSIDDLAGKYASMIMTIGNTPTDKLASY